MRFERKVSLPGGRERAALVETTRLPDRRTAVRFDGELIGYLAPSDVRWMRGFAILDLDGRTRAEQPRKSDALAALLADHVRSLIDEAQARHDAMTPRPPSLREALAQAAARSSSRR